MRRGLGRAAAALAGAVSGLARALRPGLRPWERARRLGKEMLGLQRWSEAAEAWRVAVEARPERVAGHDGLAAALGALGRWDEAAVACRRAAELEPGSERSLRLGNALLMSGRWEEAAAAYRQALALGGGAPDGELLVNLGAALWKSGRLAEAAAAYGRAAEIAPGHLPAAKNLGAVLGQLERWEESAAALRRVVEAAPGDGEAFFSLGGVLWKAERWEEAMAAYRRAAELEPGHAAAHRNLAAVLCQLRRWEEAARSFRRVAELEPGSVDAWTGLGCALLNAERREESVAALDRALALAPGEASTHLNRGAALSSLERWDEAISAYRRAAELVPREARGALELAGALWRTGRREEAVSEYRRATRLAPDDVAAHRNLAAVLGQLERWDEAATVYRRALQIDRGAAEVHPLLGSALLRAGRLEEAADALRAGIVAAPDSAETYALLGFTLSRQGRTREAEAAYRAAVRLAPDLAERFALPAPGLAWKRVDEGEATLREEMAPAPAPGVVPDRVLRLERWIEGMASGGGADGSSAGAGPAPSAAPGSIPEARLLFVLDNDYGELTTLMYLLLGQELLGRSTLLLPDRLYASNRDVLPGRTHRYRTVADILAAVDTGRPRVVFLLSGYLFAIHRIFSLQALQVLVGELRRRGCRVVTSDPFLGVLSRHDVHDVVSVHLPERYRNPGPDGDVEPDAGIRRVLTREVDRSLRLLLSGSEQILRDLPHLYPAHPGVPTHLAGPGDGRNLSFFNPRLLATGDAGLEEPLAAGPGTAPHWLFVLSATDYETQYVEETKEVFARLVMAKLRETVRAGRRAFFVGPKDLIQFLEAAGPAEEGITFLSFCSFRRFTALLLGAEYAFYWNVVSHSVLVRLFNRLPVFLFDRGHLVRNVAPLYERVVAWYYQGWEPDYLDHREPLEPAALARLAAGFREAAGAMRRGFERAPAPAEMVRRILGPDPAPAREGRTET